MRGCFLFEKRWQGIIYHVVHTYQQCCWQGIYPSKLSDRYRFLSECYVNALLIYGTNLLHQFVQKPLSLCKWKFINGNKIAGINHIGILMAVCLIRRDGLLTLTIIFIYAKHCNNTFIKKLSFSSTNTGAATITYDRHFSLYCDILDNNAHLNEAYDVKLWWWICQLECNFICLFAHANLCIHNRPDDECLFPNLPIRRLALWLLLNTHSKDRTYRLVMREEIAQFKMLHGSCSYQRW